MTFATAPQQPPGDMPGVITRALAIQIFIAFALAYFLSAAIRAITATLSPTLRAEFNLSAADLGLLAGGYFFGFALTQLPLGRWLDRHGPRRVILSLLAVAVLGCLAFAAAPSFTGLLLARVLCGIGLSACLMAALTAFRLWYPPESLLRANSWMLMVGSLGMVASTLPVQWLLPVTGWRPLFWGLALLVAASIAVLAWRLPGSTAPAESATGAETQGLLPSYAEIWRHPYFRRHAPMAFFSYGGLVAMQTLWAGPWLVQVSGQTPAQAAQGLFWINVCMLVTFWVWGTFNPRLSAAGWHADRLITAGLPASLALVALIAWQGAAVTWPWWAAFCVSASFISLAQPAVGMAFAKELAGRALSAYNLVIFTGIFCVQWGFGLLIDGFVLLGLSTPSAFQASLAVYLVCCVAAYGRYVRG